MSIEDKAARDNCITNVNRILSDVISLEDLSVFPRTIEDDVFLRS